MNSLLQFLFHLYYFRKASAAPPQPLRACWDCCWAALGRASGSCWLDMLGAVLPAGKVMPWRRSRRYASRGR